MRVHVCLFAGRNILLPFLRTFFFVPDSIYFFILVNRQVLSQFSCGRCTQRIFIVFFFVVLLLFFFPPFLHCRGEGISATPSLVVFFFL